MNADEIFVTALDIDDRAERNAYLDHACGGNDLLRRELDSLLAAHDRIGAFLRVRPTLLAGAALGVAPSGSRAPGLAEAGTASQLAEQPGDCIGRYKLLEPIGEGGMGVVWMAEQEEPVRRRVALKIIKPGMDTRQVIARFEAERQALALMDHPNIAKFFDAGVTGDPLTRGTGGEGARGAGEGAVRSQPPSLSPRPSVGRPYFVMELIKGIPITRYCDEAKLSIRERLELVAQVCRAVQHAHQKGIIHRDLKPSNVLVTVLDDRPVPKVIDFGVAKATEARLTEKTLFTAFAQLIGTPAYMSPEQAGLGSLDIDTRSDVYSLGVLLYQLLTGHTPFDTRALLQEGYESLLRTIREADPPKPSTRLTRELIAADTSQRPSKSEIRNLKSQISQDLDWIVMKCLEKDRNRRYETANDLSADLGRYLHDEPVLARPPSVLYRCRKFARKHRTGVAAAAAFVLLLAGATAVSTTLALWANRERQRAQQAATAARAEQHKTSLARDAEHDARLREQQQRKAAEAAQARALSAESEARENERQAKLAEANAKASESNAKESEAVALAVLEFFQDKVLAATRPEGKAGGLGREATIRAAVEAAEPTIEKSFADQPFVEASIRRVLGMTYQYLGESTLAVRQFTRALELHKSRLGMDHPATLKSMSNLAAAYESVGRWRDALPLFEEVLRLRRSKLGSNNSETITSLNNLAFCYQAAGRPSDALPLQEEAVKLSESILPPTDPGKITLAQNLGRAYQSLGRFPEAIGVYEKALNLARTVHGPDHLDTLLVMNNLAVAYQAADQWTNAVTLLEGLLEPSKVKRGPDHPETLAIMSNLGLSYRAIHRLADALSLLEETVKLSTAKLGRDHPKSLMSMNNLGLVYSDTGRLPAAIKLFEEVLVLRKEKLGLSHPDTLNSLANLASAYRAANRISEAVPLFEEALTLRKANLGPDHPNTLTSMRGLAGAYVQVKRFADGEKVLRELAERIQTARGAESRSLAEIQCRLAECLLAQDKYSAAESLLLECLPRLEKREPGQSLMLNAQGLLGWALSGQKKFAEAEPLMVQAYNGLRQREVNAPSVLRARIIKQTGEMIVALYEAWGKPELAAQWRQKLSALAKPDETLEP